MPKLKQIKQKITLVSKLKTENTVLKLEIENLKAEREDLEAELGKRTSDIRKEQDIAREAVANSTRMRRKVTAARAIVDHLMDMLDSFSQPED